MTDEIKIKIPDIGGAKQVDVIEILVKPGDVIDKDTSLITLESDKASMDIPAPQAGKVGQVLVKVGDKVSEGDAILTLIADTPQKIAVSEPKSEPQGVTSSEEKKEAEPIKSQKQTLPKTESLPLSTEARSGQNGTILAGPAVRRMARELGVHLEEVAGSGRKARVTKEDLQLFVKTKLNEKAAPNSFALPKSLEIDFSQFGAIEVKPLNKIKKLTGANVHRSWITVPHVTQFDEADITELELFRKIEADKTKQTGYKLTLLAFVTKVVSKALVLYPQFNASLDSSGEHLIYKHYCNIGIAVETPNGLVVPVIKNVDQLSVIEIALEMTRLSTKAREKGLMPGDMSGGCFTISSLGGIGGTAFTPIVNTPEVAILGLSRASMKPIYEGEGFRPRLMLPLSLSYDHRVIDGAEGARFTRYIADSLGDIRRILL